MNPLVNVYESERLKFHIERRKSKMYLHTEVKLKPSKTSVVEAYDVIQHLGEEFGELFTYSVDDISAKLCERNGFFPTDVLVEAHWDQSVMLPEWWLSNGRAIDIINLGKKAHEALGELSGPPEHQTDGHNFAVGLFLERCKIGKKMYATEEYNVWAEQHKYAPIILLEDGTIECDGYVVEIP